MPQERISKYVNSLSAGKKGGEKGLSDRDLR